jgi:hypothetical protein
VTSSHRRSVPPRRPRRLVALTLSATVVLSASAAVAAEAAHWPFFGGDAGRSGYQPVNEGIAPVSFRYARPDTGVVTSPITTAGSPQRVAYGTSNGRVFLRQLTDGAGVGPAGSGIDIDEPTVDDPNTFTGLANGSVAFASTSGPGLGQLYVVHNDDNQDGNNDIGIAQIDEAGGTLVGDAAVAGTNGNFEISSSPLVTPEINGTRALYFTAENVGASSQALFRVDITAGDLSGAATAISTGDIGLNPQASPTLVYLNNASGTPTAYVAVGTRTGQIRTFEVADPTAAGPTITGTIEDASAVVSTPSVPVTPAGAVPGTTGSGLATAPAIYAAYLDAGTTEVARLV